jgi:hypothetical protein
MLLPSMDHLGGFFDGAASVIDSQSEKRLDEIEMIGEEEAGGLRPRGHSDVSAGMRYLHCSRTINQLITDRNRAVAIYVAVASLLWTASAALLNAKPAAALFVPIEMIQLWCLPITFGVLTILAFFTAFLLIRTRIGLIYEVAKMNVLLGLPAGRVTRIGWLSIFFILQAMISLAGGGSGMLLTYFMLYREGGAQFGGLGLSILVGVAVSAFLIILYIAAVLYTTADKKLAGGK